MKRGLALSLGLIFLGLLWYFFLKPQDYQIRVNANSFPSVINQSLQAWNATLDSSSISPYEDLKPLKQNILFGDSTHIYTWNITQVTDSTSMIKVDVLDEENSFMNKLKIPFKDTDFEKRSRQTVTDFIESLNEFREEFRITLAEEEKFETNYCACVHHKTSRTKKAVGMMESYPYLNSVIVGNGIQLNGVPFIEVKEWNVQKDSIAFNFCYPIVKTDSLPEIQDLEYKEVKGRKSLKAIYNGNYKTSDLAWYALLDYAEKNKIEVHKTPVEFFFNNPNMGGDALYWTAEVFLPLKNQNE